MVCICIICIFKRVLVCVCMQRLILGVFLSHALPHSWKQGRQCPRLWGELAIQLVPGMPRLPSCHTHGTFMGGGDLNSRPHICTASTLAHRPVKVSIHLCKLMVCMMCVQEHACYHVWRSGDNLEVVVSLHHFEAGSPHFCQTAHVKLSGWLGAFMPILHLHLPSCHSIRMFQMGFRD